MWSRKCADNLRCSILHDKERAAAKAWQRAVRVLLTARKAVGRGAPCQGGVVVAAITGEDTVFVKCVIVGEVGSLPSRIGDAEQGAGRFTP